MHRQDYSPNLISELRAQLEDTRTMHRAACEPSSSSPQVKRERVVTVPVCLLQHGDRAASDPRAHPTQIVAHMTRNGKCMGEHVADQTRR